MNPGKKWFQLMNTAGCFIQKFRKTVEPIPMFLAKYLFQDYQHKFHSYLVESREYIITSIQDS